MYDGKPANEFGYEGRPLSNEKSIEVIHENHKSYKKLVKGEAGKEEQFWLGNT